MKFRFMALIGVVSLAGLCLVGAGASGQFTTSTSSAQPITAGSLNVTLSTTVADASGNDTATLTFPSPGTSGLVGSTFVAVDPVTITNDSNIQVSEVAIQLTDPDSVSNKASAALDTETYACLYSDGELLYNEPMPTVEGYGNAAILGTIAAGATDSYTVVFYAGNNGTSSPTCGGAFSGWSNSPYGGFPSEYNSYESVPQAASAVPSLNTDAEGGMINPTFTLTYEG